MKDTHLSEPGPEEKKTIESEQHTPLKAFFSLTINPQGEVVSREVESEKEANLILELDNVVGSGKTTVLVMGQVDSGLFGMNEGMQTVVIKIPRQLEQFISNSGTSAGVEAALLRRLQDERFAKTNTPVTSANWELTFAYAQLQLPYQAALSGHKIYRTGNNMLITGSIVELIPGKNLADEIESGFTDREKPQVILDICKALLILHPNRAHGEFKPESVMITRQMHQGNVEKSPYLGVKLIDFGTPESGIDRYIYVSNIASLPQRKVAFLSAETAEDKVLYAGLNVAKMSDVYALILITLQIYGGGSVTDEIPYVDPLGKESDGRRKITITEVYTELKSLVIGLFDEGKISEELTNYYIELLTDLEKQPLLKTFDSETCIRKIIELVSKPI